MKKFLLISTTIGILIIVLYFTFVNTATYSEGVRSGELIKVSHKGMVFKTWEGEISQGISGAQIFSFSVLDSEKEVITSLQEMEGQYVQVNYQERYRTFPWWGDTRYFISSVKKVNSPFKVK
jgi:hypothetical protein